jgi:hypothetical protein
MPPFVHDVRCIGHTQDRGFNRERAGDDGAARGSKRRCTPSSSPPSRGGVAARRTSSPRRRSRSGYRPASGGSGSARGSTGAPPRPSPGRSGAASTWFGRRPRSDRWTGARKATLPSMMPMIVANSSCLLLPDNVIEMAVSFVRRMTREYLTREYDIARRTDYYVFRHSSQSGRSASGVEGTAPCVEEVITCS